MTDEIFTALKIVWDSLYDADELKKADVILAFGCADPMVAQRAAALYLEGYAPYIVFSGGLGKGTEGRLVRSEAEHYADIAFGLGVPREHMLLEKRSTNTGENLRFTYELLKGYPIREALVVHQPNMGKRIRATLARQWPDSNTVFRIAPADRSLENYLERLGKCGLTEHEMVSNITGDFQRMDVYAKMGYQIPVEMPAEAWEAFEKMKAWGYTRYIIR